MNVDVRYKLTSCSGEEPDWAVYSLELDVSEESAYKFAKKTKVPFCDVFELEDALDRAYDEILDKECENGFDSSKEGWTLTVEFVQP